MLKEKKLTKEKLKDYIYLLLVPIILLGSYFLLRKKLIKKSIDEMLLEELINDTKRKIKIGDIELAKQNYKQIQKAYNSLRNKTRKIFYPEIKKVYSAIIKREIVELLKEYDEATKKMDREKAELSFRKINEIYKKIDEETKERLQKKIEFISLIKK
ncbi:MAG: hypothetical protein QW103_00325 [Candidatus Pacearchaeota archaeon]